MKLACDVTAREEKLRLLLREARAFVIDALVMNYDPAIKDEARTLIEAIDQATRGTEIEAPSKSVRHL